MDDIAAKIAQVDRMLDRVDKVIGRERPEKPLRPDISYPRRAKPNKSLSMPSARVASLANERPAIASGELTGNEMRIGNGYSPRPREDDCCDPDGMWAAFEADFDDMVKGMH